VTPVEKALWYDVLWAIVITIVAVQRRLRGHGGHCLATVLY
jgi:hypothetical protein